MSSRTVTLLALLGVLVFPPSVISAELLAPACYAWAASDLDGWERQTEAGATPGVYARKLPGREYRDYKGIMSLDHSTREVLALIYDPATSRGGCGRFFPDCTEAAIVSPSCVPERPSPPPQTSSHLHLVFQSTFPLVSRGIARQVFLRRTLSSTAPEIALRLEAMPITPCLQRSSATPLKELTGTWRLRSEANGTTCVAYGIYTDPAVPALLRPVAERSLLDAFVKTLLNLKALLSETPGR